MFKNEIKKFAAVGLVFSLCVPCCFASAQPGKNGMGIPLKNSESQQNQTIDEEFLRMLQNIRIPAELLSQQTQRRPSALEDLWTAFSQRLSTNRGLEIDGHLITSAQGLASAIRQLHPQDSLEAYYTLVSIGAKHLGYHLFQAQSYARFAIHDIYNMNQETFHEFLVKAFTWIEGPIPKPAWAPDVSETADYYLRKYEEKYQN